MNIPADLRYTKTHEWIKEENGVVTVGLSDFAQQELGDLVFINLPVEGDEEMRSRRARRLPMWSLSRP